MNDGSRAQEIFGDDFLEMFSDSQKTMIAWLAADRSAYRQADASILAWALKTMLDAGWPEPAWTMECRQDFFRFVAELPLARDIQ
jgi:hypothetical protein